MNFEKLPQDERMGSPQEREAVLWGEKKLVKNGTKMGQKVDKRWTKDGQMTAHG